MKIIILISLIITSVYASPHGKKWRNYKEISKIHFLINKKVSYKSIRFNHIPRDIELRLKQIIIDSLKKPLDYCDVLSFVQNDTLYKAMLNTIEKRIHYLIDKKTFKIIKEGSYSPRSRADLNRNNNIYKWCKKRIKTHNKCLEENTDKFVKLICEQINPGLSWAPGQNQKLKYK